MVNSEQQYNITITHSLLQGTIYTLTGNVITLPNITTSQFIENITVTITTSDGILKAIPNNLIKNTTVNINSIEISGNIADMNQYITSTGIFLENSNSAVLRIVRGKIMNH